jgi:hypothetical protein
LTVLGAKERDALFTSLAIIVRTADYHVKRFDGLLASVNQRRRAANALITCDLTVEYAVFEAAAALTAIRSAVDEIIFIAARLSGVSRRRVSSRSCASAVLIPSSLAPKTADATADARTIKNPKIALSRTVINTFLRKSLFAVAAIPVARMEGQRPLLALRHPGMARG